MRALGLSKHTVKKAIEKAKLAFKKTASQLEVGQIESPPSTPQSPNSDNPPSLDDLGKRLEGVNGLVLLDTSSPPIAPRRGIWSLLGRCGNRVDEVPTESKKAPPLFSRILTRQSACALETWSAQVYKGFPKREAITQPEAGEFVVVD